MSFLLMAPIWIMFFMGIILALAIKAALRRGDRGQPVYGPNGQPVRLRRDLRGSDGGGWWAMAFLAVFGWFWLAKGPDSLRLEQPLPQPVILAEDTESAPVPTNRQEAARKLLDTLRDRTGGSGQARGKSGKSANPDPPIRLANGNADAAPDAEAPSATETDSATEPATEPTLAKLEATEPLKLGPLDPLKVPAGENWRIELQGTPVADPAVARREVLDRAADLLAMSVALKSQIKVGDWTPARDRVEKLLGDDLVIGQINPRTYQATAYITGNAKTLTRASQWFYADQADQKSLVLVRTYAGAVFVVGGLAVLLRLGTGRRRPVLPLK